jgi:hypothetical protein
VAVPADLNTVNNPTTGQPIPASWGDHVRTWVEFLADPPRVFAYHDTTQSKSTGTTLSALVANSELYDTDSMHTTSGSTGRITINTDGDYFFTVVLAVEADAAGNRATAFTVDNTTDYLVDLRGGVATNSIGVSGHRTLSLVAGQYVEVKVWQNSGSDKDYTLDEFSARWIGR